MKAGFWLLAIVSLVLMFVDSMWNKSTDLAQHYALVARLAEHWHLPSGYDRTLAEMNFYPRGAHALAAMLSQGLHSDLLSMHLLAQGAVFAIWAAVILLLLNLPGPARWWSSGAMLGLVYLNALWPGFEFHGEELIGNYFFAQLMAQAGALGVVVVTLYAERAGRGAWYRNLLLLAACWLIEMVHLLPAIQLLGFFTLLLLFDALEKRTLAGYLQSLLWLALALVLVLMHPTYDAMKVISRNDGTIDFILFNRMSVIIIWSVLVAMMSMLTLWRWYGFDAQRRQLWLVWKMLGAFGLAVAGFCLLQTGAWHLGEGSEYAVKKHLYALNTMALLQLVLWLGGYAARFGRLQLQGMPHGIAALLLVAVVCGILPHKKTQDVSDLVVLEREMQTLRTMIVNPPGKYTYVLQLDRQLPFINYLYSSGIFRTPRFRDGYEVWSAKPLAKNSLVGSIITGAASPLARFPACHRNQTPHGLIVVDYACMKREAGLVDTWFSLLDEARLLPCKLDGFGDAEPLGRWTIGHLARLSCVIPKSQGKPFERLVLASEAFLGQAKQRVQVVQNGMLTNEFVFVPGKQAQEMEIDLQNAIDGRIDIELRLPDAHSPRSVGLGTDSRALGILIEALEFRMK